MTAVEVPVEFVRNFVTRWHDEVPGARWFRADLHTHTLDDHPNANLSIPSGVGSDPSDAATRVAYARYFLQTAIVREIEVIGLTPHAVRCAGSDDSSATWQIVETWNNDTDDDGVPFREKIYAVFPGFEPSLSDGSRGVHLLFLFDPEVGRDRFIRAFHAVMGGMEPYDGGSLRNTGQTAKEVFESLRALHANEGNNWDFICLAPHAFSSSGLLHDLKSQMLRRFPHHHVAGIELGDNKLLADAVRDRDWLLPNAKGHHHGFFHASDAYRLNQSPYAGQLQELGSRFTLFKMASPRIESLRQAFLAYDTRLKRVYKRVDDGSLELRGDLPSPVPLTKPWLRSVTIIGGTSFFTDQSDPSRAQVFPLNPDLTCIIGARMSGKSAFLDGLRYHCELAAPSDAAIARDSRERFEHVFNSGEPTVALGILGPFAETMHPGERWPARCFSQREIESAANDPDVRRDLLFRLLPQEADGLTARERRLDELADELSQIPGELNRLRAEFHEKWSAFVESREAAQAILRFKKAGIGELRKVQQQHGLLVDVSQTLDSSAPQLRELIAEVDPGDLEDVAVSSASDLKRALRRYKLALRVARHYGRIAKALVQDCLSDSDVQCDHAWSEVIARIVAAGGTAEEIQQFEALARLASNVEITRRSLRQVSERVKAVQHDLRNALKEREQLRHEQRRALKRLEYTIARRFEDRIRIRVLCDRINDSLTEWILSLRSAPVTTWWNKLKATNEAPTPQKLMQALCARKKTTPSRSLSISEAVWNNLVTAADETRIDELSTIANDDDYRVELCIDENRGIYKDISKLSGGARVSVVLSLILEGDDHSPLVIDQPEDQLDRRFLFRDLLPAIHRRKSKAQIILATHDANLVVNGDADLVVWLDADGERGWVKRAHAIDDSEIRDAVLELLDGGEEAFQLRREKYGF